VTANLWEIYRINRLARSIGKKRVKYFFLSDGWIIGRVWELGGLWNEIAWRRKPEIRQTPLYILEQDEKLWLYQVEEAVLMVEVKPGPMLTDDRNQPIGQVVLKRLITADQVVEILTQADVVMGKADIKLTHRSTD
jgi:hypothetical protein